MTPLLQTHALTKKYRHRRALTDCTLSIPQGRITGLVGPNGAGKTTLLNLAAGHLRPTTGTIHILGHPPARTPRHLAQVGYVAQHAPTYPDLTISDHLQLGARLNPHWDHGLATTRIHHLGLNPAHRTATLSAGQRAQLALTLAIAKRPRLLILDEPTAALDPLARRELLQNLMQAAAEHDLNILLSSHHIADLQHTCDHLVILTASHLQTTGDTDHLLATHHRLTGPRHNPTPLPAHHHVITTTHTPRQTTHITHTPTIPHNPAHTPNWTTTQPTLEDIVLAHMTDPTHASRTRHTLAPFTDPPADTEPTARPTLKLLR